MKAANSKINNLQTLWTLEEDSSGKIMNFSDSISSAYRNRLSELGFCREELVLCLRKTPFAGPKVYQIGDSVFSVAQEIAEMVFVESLKEKSEA